jgi:hypothetical protein
MQAVLFSLASLACLGSKLLDRVPDNSGVLPFHSAGFDCSKLLQGRLTVGHVIFLQLSEHRSIYFLRFSLRRCQYRVDDRVIGEIIVWKELDRNGLGILEFDKI